LEKRRCIMLKQVQLSTHNPVGKLARLGPFVQNRSQTNVQRGGNTGVLESELHE